ncbi:hypothetical protein [Thermofilum pendens]|nr:hypothetical protein [Thermofilum pendens]
MDKKKLLVVALLLAVVAGAVYLAHLDADKREVPSETIDTGKYIDAYVSVYVNGRLAATQRMHSFTSAFSYLAPIAFTPTSSFTQTSTFTGVVEPVSAYGAALTPGSYSWILQKGRFYGCPASAASPWQVAITQTPLPRLVAVFYNTSGSKIGEAVFSGTSVDLANKVVNATGTVLYLTASFTYTGATATNIKEVHLARPTGQVYSLAPGASCGGMRITNDSFATAITVNPNDVVTVVYTFYFKKPLTTNFAYMFLAFLYNAKDQVVPLNATDGSTFTFNVAVAVPINTTISVFTSSGTVSVKEPTVTVGPGVWALSQAFKFTSNDYVTRIQLRVRFENGKDVVIVDYVPSQPIPVKPDRPYIFSVSFSYPFVNKP